MAAPGPAGAAASPSPQPPQLPSPFAELVKSPSGLEKVVLRGSRNCCVEVPDSAFPTPVTRDVSPFCLVWCVRGVCRGTVRAGLRFGWIWAPSAQIRWEVC